ncbi:basic membrane lipoprotein Med (substrate-binding protein (PBP1-ABC) superfamily) [Allocatelliglobosispora scoriae]|uniref:Basic membrane lipoprotein Med (Substrate-binding protein (PBP1-ABC) superfamily) n=1 Tax=Allocatelliglobosispora scoriae TaxID=643052 RepID=A0A841BWK1_9ACTN|nr:BMP family ABC transporter substrate-binding protein [Allocatelliglobosispora scoriae]MBB5872534.1 basic membrane lipoprotein Med (substrate-binding protein (PBP1-ABC) superfamily) [Allocatelliglobosispora scoriae]
MGTQIARWLAGPRKWVAAAVAVVLIGLVTWLVWPSPEPPRARKFLEITACLLTDDKGITGPQAAQIWAGMGDASAENHVQTEYLAVTGDQTAENALAYLNGLAMGHCDLLFATGDAQVAAVRTGAARFPAVLFRPVGQVPSAANVESVQGDDLRSAARDIVKGSLATDS